MNSSFTPKNYARKYHRLIAWASQLYMIKGMKTEINAILTIKILGGL